MGLHWSAVTLASHVALVLAIVCAFANAVAVRRVWGRSDGVRAFARIEGPVFAIAAALVVERLYYVTARLLINSDLNLWTAHPAPEALSFTVAASIFALAAAIRRMGSDPGPARRRVIAAQGAGIGTIFVGLVVGLW